MTELPVVPAPQIPVTDRFHGVEVTEDYRWLEDAAAEETVAWTKAQQHRSLELNRAEALERLQALVDSAAVAPRRRKPTRPTLASKQRRLESKVKRGRIKALRAKIFD